MNELQLVRDGRDTARVTAWMYYPRSEELRCLHVERVELEDIAAAAKDGASPIEVRADALRRLLAGPGRAEIDHLRTEAAKQGNVAGDLLHLIYQMHQRSGEEPSLSKALKAYQDFSLTAKYGDKTPLKRAEQTLRDCFEAFAPSAHLWAAYRLNGPFPYFDPKAGLLTTDDGLSHLLGVAKAVGEFATTFVPKRTRPAKPVIDPDTLVRIHDSIDAIRLTFK